MVQRHGFPAPEASKKGFPVWLTVVLVLSGVMLVAVVILGVLAVLAVTGTRKYLAASKAAEAVSSVGTLSMDAENAYNADQELCASASHPVPTSIVSVRGTKYASSPADWQADSAVHAGFACLRFEMSYPQYYQYDYQRTGSGNHAGDSFRATARGDLNGDGVTSELSRGGKIVGTDVVLDPKVDEVRPGE